MTADAAINEIEKYAMLTVGWIRSTDPLWRHADRIPCGRLAEIKSDDLLKVRPDVVALWVSK